MENEFPFHSHRSAVYSRGGMVASSQPLATAAGIKILAAGGNAADAAIATAAALNVTEPTSTGLGGDCFSLYFEATSKKVYALNGSGRAPACLTLDRIHKTGFDDELPPFHPYTITVPGACAGWLDLLERFGRLPVSLVLEPAIELAEKGFPVAPLTSWFWRRGAERQLKTALNGIELTIEGRGPNPGEVFHNPGLAKTLKLIATEGKCGFYSGEIAKAIVAIIQEAGGCMTEEDLGRHISTWEEPISVVYRGMRIWECPPNGQGLVALLALNLLSGFDLSKIPALSAERLHLEIEAIRLAFTDGRAHISDPAFRKIPLNELLSMEYSDIRRKAIHQKKSITHPQPGKLKMGTDTVYFCAMDEDGNACSFINSNYMGFGTGIVPCGWGFSLQNRGHNFSLDSKHPNCLEPGKRPYHTIIPGMATRENDGSLFAPFGVMGGFMQPQGHVQVISALFDDRLDPQAALDRPRFCIDGENLQASVDLEEGIPAGVISELEKTGHAINLVSGMNRALFGRGQIITRDPITGVLCGGSDPRADGCAIGYL
jgi:gamma-glutamyltranspeptidase/glutathione hydrolase